MDGGEFPLPCPLKIKLSPSLLPQVVARYGYQDTVDHRNQFVSQVISTIMHKLELKAGLKYQVRGGEKGEEGD